MVESDFSRQEKIMIKIIKKYYLVLIILGLLLSCAALNIIVRFNFGHIMWDMTDTKRYSLSVASKKQAKELPVPVYINVYYSSEIIKENPVYAGYAEFVLQFLKQYQQQNPERIFITIKDPQPFSANAKEAQQAGLKSYLAKDGRTNLYFGAVFTDSEGNTQVIDSFSQGRDFWLEKDITDIFRGFNQEQRNIIGLISPIHNMINQDYSAQAENYAFINELTARYDILPLRSNISEIPLEVDVLILAAPQKISQGLMYALDQYVLRGGNLIILADKWVEKPLHKTTSEAISQINKLLNNWGLEITDAIVGSSLYGKPIYIAEASGGSVAPYPLWLKLPKKVLNHHQKMMSSINTLNMRSPLAIKEVQHDKENSITPLVTITEGMLYPYDARIFNKNHIISTWKDEYQTYILAALSEGKYNSIFSQQPASASKNVVPYLYYSVEKAKILVIGDSDFIRDDVWLEDGKLSDNGQLLLRAVEIFNGRDDMSDLHKSQVNLAQNSLGEKLYNRIYQRHMSEITRLQHKIQDLGDKYEDLRQAVQNNKIPMDATVSRQLTSLQDKIKQKQEQLKFWDYELKRSFDSQKQNIIFVNLIIVPICIIIMMLLGYVIFTRRKAHRIKEKYHAR